MACCHLRELAIRGTRQQCRSCLVRQIPRRLVGVDRGHAVVSVVMLADIYAHGDSNRGIVVLRPESTSG
jgi:hypothetical protein